MSFMARRRAIFVAVLTALVVVVAFAVARLGRHPAGWGRGEHYGRAGAEAENGSRVGFGNAH